MESGSTTVVSNGPGSGGGAATPLPAVPPDGEQQARPTRRRGSSFLGDDRRKHVTVAVPDGKLLLTPAEYKLFYQLFTILGEEYKQSGKSPEGHAAETRQNPKQGTIPSASDKARGSVKAVGGIRGAGFLRRSGLGDKVLEDIWREACGGRSKIALGREEWFIALRLTQLAQKAQALKTAPCVRRAAAMEPNLTLGAPWFRGVLEPLVPDLTVDLRSPFAPTMCRVQVGFAEVVGTGLTQYVTYRVITKSSLSHFHRPCVETTRRYSDFRWLHRRLRARFPATVIPPIPAKRVFGNMSPTFVSERQRSLQHFMQNVICHPKLGTSFEVQAVLDCSPEGFRVYRKMADAIDEEAGSTVWGASQNLDKSESDAEDEDEDEGDESAGRSGFKLQSAMQSLSENNWFSRILSTVQGPSDSGEFRRELARLGVRVDQLAAVRDQMQDRSKRLQATISVIEKLLASRRAQAYELARTGAYVNAMAQLDVEDEESESAQANLFADIASRLDQVSNQAQDMNDRCSSKLLAPLKYQRARVGALLQVLDAHDCYVASLQSAHDSLASAKKRYAAARKSGGGGSGANSVEEAQAAIGDARARIAKQSACLVQLDASVKEEIGKFDRERFADLATILSNLASNEAQGAAALRAQLVPLRTACSDGDNPGEFEKSSRRMARSNASIKNLPSWFARKASIADSAYGSQA